MHKTIFSADPPNINTLSKAVKWFWFQRWHMRTSRHLGT